MNNTDRLFKEKLAEHSLTPRPQAWEKLESQLAKKNKSILWIRLAAAVATVGLLTFVLLNRQPASNQLAESTQPVATKPEVKETPPEIGEENPSAEPAQKPIHKKKFTPIAEPVQEAPPEVTPTVTALETVAHVELETTETMAKVRAEAKKSIVLVYELPTIKQSTPAATAPVETVVVAGDEKQNGIQKILETAKEVKNSDNPWGELREAKNELLALDFKKDKNRNQ